MLDPEEQLVSEFRRKHSLTDEEAEALALFGTMVVPETDEPFGDYLERILRLWRRATRVSRRR